MSIGMYFYDGSIKNNSILYFYEKLLEKITQNYTTVLEIYLWTIYTNTIDKVI